ncbi:MAG: sugar transferase [Thermoanaerobaculia bacterium]|jgi:exopolysaccharide biosynthesis polyprenyl glycosylphosphotransferase|nr:sugar transferase [Thermoanaerobaculia bacterium]MBP9823251.1 sugar transferase [Thermoanaerobaculia bacterium]
MLKQQARLIASLVFLLDLALISAAFLLAHALRSHLLPALGGRWIPGALYPVERYLPLLPLALVLWSLLLWSSGRYRSHRTVPVLDEATAIVRITATASILFLLIVWAFRLDERLLDDDRLSRIWIALFAFLSGALLLFEKLALRVSSRYVRAHGFNYRTVLIVGANEAARSIAASILGHRFWGYRVAGFVADEDEAIPESLGGLPVLGRVSELGRIVEEQVIDEVLFAIDRRDFDRFEDLFLRLQEQGIITRFALNFFPHAKASVQLEDLDGVPLLTFSTGPTSVGGLLLKRTLDIVLGAALLVLALPILGLLALLIRFTSRGAVLFRQVRCGRNGRLFTLYKFRTMIADAEERRREIEHLNEMDGPVFKARNDPRVTRFGRLLRKFSLDELPQLWNVLKGDMSLVGPRPPIPEEVAQYERWQRRRLAMKPGLTCLWQISGRNELDFDQWMKLDLAYIDNWSPWLDLKILVRTVPVVLSGRGAS